ncbi:hypothetical protein [Sphingomonas morindae]|uniref:Uncharacterized protein n=1 Tax=Sphingomonas morindae TaxID=1541170 RepID=A0ABY4XA24_9SPHN|nr:hypothetical protein [Sphingomonas morindae]USI73813.1 hypothetical protein LHA26_04930 [Sphingomonas morindae]
MTESVRPEDILADGADHIERDGRLLRKGTVAAFLANARAWLEADGPPETRAAREAAMRAAVPALAALGLLDLFVARDPRLAALLAEARESA